MEAKDLIIALIGGLWTVGTILTSLIRDMNGIRDSIVIGYRDGRKLTVAHKRVMYQTGWIAFTCLGICLCLAFGTLCLFAPMAHDAPAKTTAHDAVIWASRFSGWFAILLGLWWIPSAINDRAVIVPAISRDPDADIAVSP